MITTGETIAYRVKVISLLLLSSLFTVFLVKVRLDWTGTIHFRFLAWNLLLAWIPYLISMFMLIIDRYKASWLMQLPLIGLWLLFFPNAMYIITDLLHLKPRHPIPMWFDVVMIFSCAWNGLILGYLSLKDVQRVVGRYIGRYLAAFSSVVFLLLSGLGIYLGRYNRWNSWDVVHTPDTIASDMMHYVLYPSEHLWLYKFTLVMGVFLILGYVVFFVLTERVQLQVVKK